MAYSGRWKPAEEKRQQEREEETAEQKESFKQPQHQPTFSLNGLLKRIEAVGLETDDLLLALVLYLMYRESGDKDLLILLGAMLLS